MGAPRLYTICDPAPISERHNLFNTWHKLERWLFYGATVLLLLPLWTVHNFPSQDGPLHLYNAVAVRDYDRADRPLFREFYLPNTTVSPNWVCPHVLPVLLRWMSPPLAEKCVLSAYLLLFPLSVRYCLVGIRRHAAPLAIAALPFVPNQFYHMGFQDFCLSLAGFFITLGYFLRRRERLRTVDAVVLAALLLATYITHLLSAVMLLPMIGLIALFEAYSPKKRPRTVVRDLLPVVAAMLPVTIVTLYFLSRPHYVSQPFEYPKGWAHRFYFLVSWMKGLGWLDLIPASAVLILFSAVTAKLIRDLRRTGAWNTATIGLPGALLTTACAYFFLFLLAPDNGGGGSLILFRLAAYPLFALLLWWAAFPIPPAAFRKLQMILASVSLPALVVMLTLDRINYSRIDHYLADFEALAPHVAPNSTLLPVHFENYAVFSPNDPEHRVAVGVDPFRHAACYGLADRGIINLGNDWASTDHQALTWRNGLNPLDEDLREPQIFQSYTRRTGVSIDYIVLWSGGLPHNDLEGRAVKAQLSGYQLIYRSPEDGYLELYRKTDAKPTLAAAHQPASHRSASGS